ncbi:MAG: hypothetical protein K0S08_331 [Gammaproteobacteria bacterium]|nr:hypothetical protein [Gammaproteobacteria bacterium]
MGENFKVNDIYNHNVFDKRSWVAPSVALLAIDETQNGSEIAPESSNGSLVTGS